MKAKDIILTVTGHAKRPDEEGDTMRLFARGKLDKTDNKWRLRYTESLAEDLKQNITMTMHDGTVIMNRSGVMASDMVFRTNQHYESRYLTPYGALDMAIMPTHVEYHIDDEQYAGEVKLKYQLDIQGEFASFHDLVIRFCQPQHLNANKKANAR